MRTARESAGRALKETALAEPLSCPRHRPGLVARPALVMPLNLGCIIKVCKQDALYQTSDVLYQNETLDPAAEVRPLVAKFLPHLFVGHGVAHVRLMSHVAHVRLMSHAPYNHVTRM